MFVEEHNGRNLAIVLNIPGRVRLKIPELQKNLELAEYLCRLCETSGVLQVEANVYSKSLLILYEPHELGLHNLLSRVEDWLDRFTIVQKQNQELLQHTASAVESALPLGQVKDQNPDSIREQWHQISVQELLHLLQTDAKNGLNPEQVKLLIKQLGPNEFQERPKPPLIVRFLSQFDGFLIKLLLGASVVSVFLGQVGDALTILALITVEAMLGVWQSYKAEKSLESLKEYTTAKAKVLREGTVQQIPATELVPGDVILLEAGDMIPADARLLDSANLEVNEASLTGESLPVEKSHKVKYATKVPVAERKNMIYMGTTVTKGTGKAVIVQTGMTTELGFIAQSLNNSQPDPTPLQNDLNNLARIISYASLGICGGIILLGSISGQPFLEMLRTGVSLAIGAIPEGLTSALTISLAFGVQRMAKKGAIVKELPVTETLSCADVICTDKTGTLTTGEMTVTEVYTSTGLYKITGSGNSTEGKFYKNDKLISPAETPDLERLITVGALCNNSTYKRKERTLKVLGDPTEGALWVMAAKANLHTEDFHCYTREKEVAFDSETKRMVVICKDAKNMYHINLKGDPNIVLSRCTRILDGNTVRELTPDDKLKVNLTIEDMANHALRVIGFAYKEEDSHPEDDNIETELIFAGLAGMMDPPRPEVADAIKKCHKAGIKLVMITGDHKRTAEAIGKQIHILDQGGITITGEELDSLSDAELREKIDDIAIFARTSPHQKLRIVKALKDKGHIVVMTGDGVNDAPAIKEANIGIAMGKNGTDVTIESSSIILTDDNFTTIVNAIEEGRSISGNIKKFIRFILAGNLGEVLAIFASAVLGMPAALVPGQILMVNLVTEGIPALAIGVDTADKNHMNIPPRDSKKSIFDRKLSKKILSRGVMIGVSTFGIYALTLMTTGNLLKARTMAYANLVANQMFHVFDCRKGPLSENKYILPSVLISSALVLGTIYLTPLQGLFGTCAIGGAEWLAILFMSSFIGRLDFLKEKATQLVQQRYPRVATTV